MPEMRPAFGQRIRANDHGSRGRRRPRGGPDDKARLGACRVCGDRRAGRADRAAPTRLPEDGFGDLRDRDAGTRGRGYDRRICRADPAARILALTPKQSEIIALASEIGKLSLSLRSLVSVSAETPMPADQVADATSPAPPADSRVSGAPPTVTVDSEVSPLLPKSLQGSNHSDTGAVTILRGSGKKEEAPASQPASNGS